MKRMRNFRLPLVVATTLGILAACDVSDSPSRAAAPTTATFSPRILAPAGGVRPADRLHVQVWSRDDRTGAWAVVFEDTSMAPNLAKIQVKVPLGVRLKYRIAGYSINFPQPGKRQIDTVWSASKDDVRAIYDQVPVTENSAAVAKNWALPPTTPHTDGITFLPGNAATFKSTSPYRVAAKTDPSVSCADAKDTSAIVPAPIGDSLRIWVISCGPDDTSVVPTKPRRYAWAIDTSNTSATRTPIAPVVTGNPGFVTGQILTTSQTDPTTPVLFSATAGEVIAWDVRLDDSISATPDSSAYPPVPASLATAKFRTDSAKIDLWSQLKGSVGEHPGGFRVLVTAVRIDTSLGRGWVSVPTRFWFTVTPPSVPSRFTLTARRWDSVSVTWDLSAPDLSYEAWYAPGRDIPDLRRATPVPPAKLLLAEWGLNGLQPESSYTVLVRATDRRTGLSSQQQLNAKTLALPTLPVPSLLSPNFSPASVKKSAQDSLVATWTPDSAGRSLKVRYGWSRGAAATPDGWPDLAQAATTTLSSSLIKLSGNVGDSVRLSFATEDSLGRRSDPVHQILVIVADNVEVGPDAPRNLRLVARTASSLSLAWDSMPGLAYTICYKPAGRDMQTQELDSSHFTIRGLAGGTQVDSIAVLARSLADSTKYSGWSPLLKATTRNPPPDPARAESRWIVDQGVVKLRWSWTRVAGTTDSIAIVGVSDSLSTPSSVNWLTTSSSTAGTDYYDIPFPQPSSKPLLAFGIRSFRDSLPSATTWAFREIPVPAPRIDSTKLRIWQAGNVWKLLYTGEAPPKGFVLRALVSQVVGTTSVKDSFDISTALSTYPLAALRPNAPAGGHFYWQRTDPLGIPLFDRGAEYFIAKTILAPPSEFTLTPAPTDGSWTFQSALPTDETAYLRRFSGKNFQNRTIAEYDTIIAMPSDLDTFQIARIVDQDTSAWSPAKSLDVLGMVTGTPAPGTYLFPFKVTLTGRAPQYLFNGKWLDAGVPLNPLSFPKGTIPTRDVASFAVSPTNPLAYDFDTTFTDAAWEQRVQQGKGVAPGSKGWVGTVNAEAAWVAGERLNPAYIKVGQSALGARAVIGFSTNATGGSVFDASTMGGATIGVMSPTSTIKYTFVVGSDVKTELPPIFFPATISTTDKNILIADFTPAATLTQPYTVDAKGIATPVASEDVARALASVRWMGVAAQGPSGTYSSFTLTSIRLVPNMSRLP